MTDGRGIPGRAECEGEERTSWPGTQESWNPGRECRLVAILVGSSSRAFATGESIHTLGPQLAYGRNLRIRACDAAAVQICAGPVIELHDDALQERLYAVSLK